MPSSFTIYPELRDRGPGIPVPGFVPNLPEGSLMGIAGNMANVLQRSSQVKGAAQPGDSFTEPTVTAQDSTNAAKLGPLGYVASPTSAWTGLQSITVSGFRFHWNGTAWTAGTPSGAPVTNVFDPGDHTVAEVQEWVEAHPDEVQAILDAERAGKNRVTLTDWLDARLGAI